jgi:hypothetical protein
MVATTVSANVSKSFPLSLHALANLVGMGRHATRQHAPLLVEHMVPASKTNVIASQDMNRRAASATKLSVQAVASMVANALRQTSAIVQKDGRPRALMLVAMFLFAILRARMVQNAPSQTSVSALTARVKMVALWRVSLANPAKRVRVIGLEINAKTALSSRVIGASKMASVSKAAPLRRTSAQKARNINTMGTLPQSFSVM